MRGGEWVDALNRLPKYVVSATLHEHKWTNATVLAGEVVGEVSKLKQRIAGEIVVYASAPARPDRSSRPAQVMHSEHRLHTVQSVCHARRMAPQGQRLQELHRIDTRRRLAEAALELAEELGADQVKAEDIAQRVGVSRRTLFNYV